jgi:hypothetical protein
MLPIVCAEEWAQTVVVRGQRWRGIRRANFRTTGLALARCLGRVGQQTVSKDHWLRFFCSSSRGECASPT